MTGWLCSPWLSFSSQGQQASLVMSCPGQWQTHMEVTTEIQACMCLLFKSVYLREPRQARRVQSASSVGSCPAHSRGWALRSCKASSDTGTRLILIVHRASSDITTGSLLCYAGYFLLTISSPLLRRDLCGSCPQTVGSSTSLFHNAFPA